MLKELDWCESCDTVREREREREKQICNYWRRNEIKSEE